jgi:ABC-2 type transport system ATP-binding protein
MEVVAIEARELSVNFGARVVLDKLSLTVPVGAIYAFLGPNGAGKTTTIRALLGLRTIRRGSVSMFGLEFRSNRESLLGQVGSMIDRPSLYPNLTVEENLQVLTLLYGCDEQSVADVLEAVELYRDRHRIVSKLSDGMRQRLALAMAMLHKPRLLILDEPTNGFDPAGCREFRSLLLRLQARGVTVFLSSHQLRDVELTATHIGLLSQGQLIYEGTVHDLMMPYSDCVLVSTSQPKRGCESLSAAGFVAKHYGNDIEVRLGGRPSSVVTETLVRNGIDVSALGPRDAHLETVFFDLLSRKEPL